MIYILIYFVVNIYILLKYYKQDMGIYKAPFLLAFMSIGMVSQLTTIYYLPYYDNALLPALCYTMITCNIAFVAGYIRGEKKKNAQTILQLNSKITILKFILILFCILGLFSTIIYNQDDIDYVLGSAFKTFSFLSLSLAVVMINKSKLTKFIITILILSVISISYFAFFVKVSRTDTFILILILSFALSIYTPLYRKIIKQLTIAFLFIGIIMSASISDLRKAKQISHHVSIENYKKNFINGFTNINKQDAIYAVGMDLGNAALGINHYIKKSGYDYGFSLWDALIFCYVPKRFVGERNKESLYLFPQKKILETSFTHKITTMTGYFDAFSYFSYAGFLIFFIMGYINGIIWTRLKFSDYYFYLYLLTFGYIPIIISHGIQYYIPKLAFFLVIVTPLLYVCKCLKQLHIKSKYKLQ